MAKVVLCTEDMSKEDYLKAKYPRLKFLPDESCEKCKGEGEIKVMKNIGEESSPHMKEFTLPCLCIYIRLKR